MSEEALNERIEKLEERAAFQENAIEELSDAVTDQWKLIDAMKRDTQRLTDELKQVEDNLERGEPREPPPPHY
jgi:SlyX protein